MAVDERGTTTTVKILGDGAFAGSIADIENFSAEEDATPVHWADLGGGVGTLSFEVQNLDGHDGSILLNGQLFELFDPFAGTQRGYIEDLTVRDGALSVRASSAAVALVALRSAAAYGGTLGGALTYYLALCDVTTGFTIDPAIAALPVSLPSWNERVWDQLRKLGVIYRFEIATVAGTIVFRRLRQRTLEMRKSTEISTSVGMSNAVRSVECFYYSNVWKSEGQAYPDPNLPYGERTVISVQAGETLITNIPVNVWLTEVEQPVHGGNLMWDHQPTRSIYSVVDRDGQPVTAQQWKDMGGSVSFAIGEDGRSVDVTVVGGISSERGPYRLAASSRDRTYQYGSLFIMGRGTFFLKRSMNGLTGAGENANPTDEVFVIDDPLISTPQQAAEVLTGATQRMAGMAQTITVNSTVVNRRGDTGVLIYPTFDDFAGASPSGQTFDGWATAYANKTFNQFDAAQADLVKDDFANQAFGGIAGARVLYGDAYYRVLSGTINPEGFSWTGEFDTLHSDFDAVWAGATFSQFESQWSGFSFEQFELSPLHRD